MLTLVRKFRGAAVAVVALVLSAGGALAAAGTPPAGMPAAASDGLSRASEHSGLTLPAGPKADQQTSDQAGDAEDSQGGENAGETGDAADQGDAPDPTDGPAPTAHPDNHGSVVSAAAQATTPDGFANHGAYVSSIARGTHGSASATHGHSSSHVPPTAPTH